jgi:hypothetical protein
VQYTKEQTLDERERYAVTENEACSSNHGLSSEPGGVSMNGKTKTLFGLMSKLTFAFVAVSANSAALGDWIKIAETQNSTVYADPSTVRKVGTTAKMWYTFDYAMPQQLATNGGKAYYLSTRGQDEFDCKVIRKRRLLLTAHSKNMGGGDIVASDSTQSQWVPAPPGTVAEKMWNLACGKR